ncbi:MAG TPA: AgmX/PglI C-terminal domain-containing protein, partial [Polyangiaceae bacterium]
MRQPGRAIELFLSWGEGAAAHVLAVAYVARGELFAIGEDAGCDALVPFEALGSARAEVATWWEEPTLVPPRRSHVWIDGQPAPNQPTRLEPEQVIDATFGLFTLRARLVDEASRPVTRPRLERAWGVALSAAAHLAVLAFLSRSLPPSPSREITAERLLTMRQLLDASTARTPPRAPTTSRPARAAAFDSPPARRRADRDTTPTEQALSASSPLAMPSPKSFPVATSEREEANDFGAIALLKQGLKVDPAAEEGWDRALASLDANEARGQALYRDENVGTIAGLTLSAGSQEGGGGGKAGGGEEVTSLEIPQLTQQLREELAHPLPGGFAHIRDLRRGGPGGDTHRAPWERIPDETIGRLVRTNRGRFESCHNAGRIRNPNLAGSVNVAFTIDAGGRVTEAHDAGGELDDEAVRACVV